MEFDGISNACASCGWEFRTTNGVNYFLSSDDANAKHVQSYRKIYDTLAEKNAKTPIEGNTYVEILAERLVENIGNITNADVCDVGAGRGFFVKHACMRNTKSITAIDITPVNLELIAKTYSVRAIQANAENLPFKDEFDVIAATDVMEHVLNLSNFMLTTNWALLKGGVFAVRVPYKENMIYYSRFFGLPFPYTHLRSFNKQLLVETVEQYGFKVLRVHYDGFRSAILQDFWKPWDKLERRISHTIHNAFPSEDHVAGINPRLGRLFMKPIEITAIAVKVKDVETQNVYEDFFNF